MGAVNTNNPPTVYTNNPPTVNTWITQILGWYDPPTKLRVGLDITLLHYDDNEPYPALSTVHICISNQCLIFHMYNSQKLPSRLQKLMLDPKNTFVGLNIAYKLSVLKYWINHPGRVQFRDLVPLAFRGGVGPQDRGIIQVVARLLKQELVLPEVNPDWDFHTLSDDQIMYATVVAYMSYRCGQLA